MALCKGTEQPILGAVDPVDEVRPAFAATDGFIDALEYLFDLLVELRAVGDDKDAGIGHVLPYPLGEPDHGEAFAAALGLIVGGTVEETQLGLAFCLADGHGLSVLYFFRISLSINGGRQIAPCFPQNAAGAMTG